MHCPAENLHFIADAAANAGYSLGEHQEHAAQQVVHGQDASQHQHPHMDQQTGDYAGDSPPLFACLTHAMSCADQLWFCRRDCIAGRTCTVKPLDIPHVIGASLLCSVRL